MIPRSAAPGPGWATKSCCGSGSRRPSPDWVDCWGFGVVLPVKAALTPLAFAGMDEFQIAVYSDNALTRRAVLNAIGTESHSRMRIRCVEVATAPALERRMAAGGVDLAILDAEATPSGGLGLARQLKDEIDSCPPLIVLIARSADTWLARWSRADGAIMQPVDAVQLVKVIVALLRHPVRHKAIRLA